MYLKNPYLEQSENPWEVKDNRKPNPLIQTVIPSSNIYYSKIYQNGNWKNIWFPLEQRKIRPPRYITELSTWSGGLGIIDINTQSNSRKMDSKVIKYHQCSLEKSHAVSIELNSEF